jgi:hypothetical protein
VVFRAMSFPSSSRSRSRSLACRSASLGSMLSLPKTSRRRSSAPRTSAHRISPGEARARSHRAADRGTARGTCARSDRPPWRRRKVIEKAPQRGDALAGTALDAVNLVRIPVRLNVQKGGVLVSCFLRRATAFHFLFARGQASRARWRFSDGSAGRPRCNARRPFRFGISCPPILGIIFASNLPCRPRRP